MTARKVNNKTGSDSHLVDGIVSGNFYDKYETRNLVAIYLMNGFFSSLEELLALSGSRTIHEVGCGEGHLTRRLYKKGFDIRGSDFSEGIIRTANQISTREGVSIPFKVASVYKMDPDADSAGLMMCCEVLEHLEDPSQALKMLSKLARPHFLVSVPREPIWRILNVLRGKYWKNCGNTPGHIHHWSRSGFLDLLEKHFDIIEVRSPLPWVMALCRTRGNAPE